VVGILAPPLEHGRVDPHPVDAVHVDRHRHVVALVLHDVRHDLGQQGVPLLGLGHVVQVGQHSLIAPELDLGALHLRGGGRVAGHGPGLQDGHGIVPAAAGHGEVLPGVALFFQELLQHAHGGGLPARGPPVQHFHLSGRRAEGEQAQEQNSDRKSFHDVTTSFMR
jgi:hypothetical protein